MSSPCLDVALHSTKIQEYGFPSVLRHKPHCNTTFRNPKLRADIIIPIFVRPCLIYTRCYIRNGKGRIYSSHIKLKTVKKIGARGSLVVKALGYKPEGRGFETR
jgi:hypothetical protein